MAQTTPLTLLTPSYSLITTRLSVVFPFDMKFLSMTQPVAVKKKQFAVATVDPTQTVNPCIIKHARNVLRAGDVACQDASTASTTALYGHDGSRPDSPVSEDDRMDVDLVYPTLLSNTPMCNAETAPRTGISIGDFVVGKHVGSGGFGDVFLAQHKESGTMHAIKVIRKERARSGGIDLQIYTEQKAGRMLAELNNPFFLQLRASFHDSDNYYFVTDFLPGGDLTNDLAITRTFSEERVKFYMIEMVYALSVLHKNHIIHRDIKPENIFIDEAGHIVLGDFGLCRIFEDDEQRPEGVCKWNLMYTHDRESKEHTRHWCGTLGYAAPEVMTNYMYYDYSADIWSLGVVMFELIFGKLPFDDSDTETIVHDTIFTPVIFPWRISDDAKNLVLTMLCKDGSRRWDIEMVKGHRYFDGVNWDKVAKRKLNCKWKPELPGPIDSLMDVDHPVHVSTGQPYVAPLDPEPLFNFVSPQWEQMVRVSPQPRAAARAAFRTVKLVFKGQKIKKVKMALPAKVKHRLEAVVISPRRKPRIDLNGRRGSSQSGLMLYSHEMLQGPTACNTPVRAIANPFNASPVKGKGKRPALPPIVIPARKVPTAAVTPRSGAPSPASDSPSPDLWVETPPQTSLSKSATMYFKSLTRSVKKMRLPPIRIPARRKEPKFDLIFPDPTADYALESFGAPDMLPMPMYPALMDMDAEGNASEVYYSGASSGLYLQPLPLPLRSLSPLF